MPNAFLFVDSDGTLRARTESVANSFVPDAVITNPISGGAASANQGYRVGFKPYLPEQPRVISPQQFGENKYFSPNFRLAVPFTGGRSIAQQRAAGANLFSSFSTSIEERATLPFDEGFLYMTESGYHGSLEGFGFYASSLQSYYAYVYPRVPGGGQGNPWKYFVFNTETSLWIAPFQGTGQFGSGRHGYSDWDNQKGTIIQCEATNESISLETLANRGMNAWNAEMWTRRSNRLILLMLIAREKSVPGVLLSFGTALYQGESNLQFRNNNSLPQSYPANVTNIGGNSQGQISLSRDGATTMYTIPSGATQWAYEDFHLDYFYEFNFQIANQDYQDIWVNKVNGTQTYPYLHSKIKPEHVTALDKAHWQQNRYKMVNATGKGIIPQIRQVQLLYESNQSGFVDGAQTIYRIPFDQLQGTNGGTDDPKIWMPPYLEYSHYGVARFLSGGIPGSGLHLFPIGAGADNTTTDPMNVPQFNHHLHTVTAFFQARHDLQPYERFFDNSILVEDPYVQENQTGTYTSYDAMNAYNMDDGNYRGYRPCYSARYAVTQGGYLVMIMGGHPLGWSAERTDNVRLTGTPLAETIFNCKLRGPSTQFLMFFVPSAKLGETFSVPFTGVTAWEKPGYAGHINQTN